MGSTSQENIYNILTKTHEAIERLESKQELMLQKMEEDKEELITIISPYSNSEITGVLNNNIKKQCFTLYDQGDDFFQAINHQYAAENLENMVRQQARHYNRAELVEYHCMLGFRLMHLNTNLAIKEFEAALILDSNSIGAQLGMAMADSGSKARTHITKAYQIAEKEKKLEALPYIIILDYALQYPDFNLPHDKEKAINLLESGVQISKQLGLKSMADRFEHILLERKINGLNDEQVEILVQTQFSDCDQRTIYIDKIRCHISHGTLLYHQLKKEQEGKNSIRSAIDIAKKKKDLSTELYLKILFLKMAEHDYPWREHEKKVFDLLEEAEELGNWDLLQRIWTELAGIASFSRQNPKLAFKRLQKSLEHIENAFPQEQLSKVKDAILLAYLPRLANYAARIDQKEIEVDIRKRIVDISERIGSSFVQLMAQEEYIYAYAEQLGWKLGDSSWPEEVDQKLASNIQRETELQSEFLESVRNLNFDFFGINGDKKGYSDYKKNINFYCLNKHGTDLTPHLEYDCLKSHAQNAFIATDLGHISVYNQEDYFYKLTYIVERMLALRETVSDLNEISILYLKINPVYEWQISETPQVNEAPFIHAKKKKRSEEDEIKDLAWLEQKFNEDPQYIFGFETRRFMKLAIKFDKKETVEKFSSALDNYWRSGESAGYSWVGIVSPLIDAYRYLGHSEKELAYLCTAYVQSYSDEAGSWFSYWQSPYTLTDIMIANNKIIENRLSDNYIKDRTSLSLELSRMCVLKIADDETSIDAHLCKEVLLQTLEILGISRSLDDAVSSARKNRSHYENNRNYEFCEAFVVRQTAPYDEFIVKH